MPNSWLFVKNQRSIYILRADAHSVVVAGPGQARQQLSFDDEHSVQQYQERVAERMAAGGWILYAVDRQRRDDGRRAQPPVQERRADLTPPRH